MTTISGAPVHIETSGTEVLIRWGKHGSTTAGLAESLSTVVTVALQSGVPAYTLIEEFLNQRFTPHGPTDDPHIPHAASVVDYLARHLANHHLTPEELHKLGLPVPGSPWPDAYTQTPPHNDAYAQTPPHNRAEFTAEAG